jgi:glycosyltransferase involved in cell wall biosynthesis
MQKKLPQNVEYKNVFAKYHSKGLFKRIFITIQSAFNQGDINHITGDIHFVSLLLKKKKTILTVHDIGSVLKGRRMKKKVLRFFWFVMPFARVKYVTVISEFTKKEVLKEFKINPDKIVVIPDCVSPNIKYSEKEFNAEKPNILQIGTKPNKNLPNLIKALEGISCKLTIIGKLTNEQKQLLSKHDINYENKFNIDYTEVVEAYKNADIVSFISNYEGFGVPILEAQATGRIVVTSKLSPMIEVAGDGAVYVNPQNISEINSTLKKIISDEPTRKSIIAKGKENVNNYSAKSVASQYFNLYKKM